MIDGEEREVESRTARMPMVWLAAAFSVGILITSFLSIPLYFLFATAIICLVTALFFLDSNTTFPLLLCSSFFIGGVCFSAEIAGVSEERIKKIYDDSRIESGTPVEIEGRLSGYPESAFDGVFLSLDTRSLTFRGESQRVRGVIRLFLPIREAEQKSEFNALSLSSGTTIRTACVLTREDQYLNPGVLPRRTVLDQQGIDATCTVKSTLLIEKLNDGGWKTPLDIAHSWRQWLIEQFSARLEPATAGVMIASLLGNKHYLDKSTAEAFRVGGTFHILVISGLHVTFIGGLILWICSLFTKDRRLQMLVAGSILWLFTFAVGAEVPVVRATLMFTVFLLSRVLYRSGSLLNSLAFCCMLLLVWRPSDIFSPSFQLTVVSVFAIVGICLPLIERLRSIGSWMPSTATPFPPNVSNSLRRFCEMLYWNDTTWEIESERQIWSARIFKKPLLRPRRVVSIVFELLLVSTIVQICMLPFAVIYFHRVSPISLFLNIWAGVVIALQSVAALLAVLAGSISNALSWPFAKIAEAFNWLLIVVPQSFMGHDWASFRVPVYSGSGRVYYALFFVPIFLLVLLLHRWDVFALQRLALRSLVIGYASALSALALAALIIFHPLSAPRPNGLLSVDFLDVGQGDSAFITFPTGETMLIDGGGAVNYREESDGVAFEPDRPRIGEMVVSEFLWEKGYASIDHVVVSHADADHSQGLVDIVRNFRVGKLYYGAESVDGEADELISATKQRGTSVEKLGTGDLLEIGNARIDVIWPERSNAKPASDNNASLVMRLTFGERAFFFTGDIEKEAEVSIVSSTPFLHADVFKVPHHGSRTSSTQALIDVIQASYAVIPVGKRSMFGHPHPEVVERLRKSGADTMTTGQNGTVTFKTDGNALYISTFK